MREKIGRRRFVAGSIRLAAVAHLIHLERLEAIAHTAPLSGPERRTLRAAANAIVPAHGRMPAASTVGAVSYIEKVASSDQKLNDLVASGLREIDARASTAHAARFDALTIDRQTDVLLHVEKADAPAGFFPVLRDLVYEAYYTHPRVMKLVGYDFRSGRSRTARLEPFDAARLSRVRTMTPFYRDVKS
ncbi:MAG TPA: gluconate 2-dehydrogenase subunit 3 family protein [Vicinamibacterales bacterium]